jgi:undecaprenyl phosphate-alpha-L-ara4N flippase subunit ArnE
MTLTLAAWFLASILCDVVGQLCFKRGAAAKHSWHALVDPWVLAGVAVYAIEIVVWIRILSLVPLAVAFPIASLNFLAITLASRLWLGERVSARRWAGAALVTAGVVLVAQGA